MENLKLNCEKVVDFIISVLKEEINRGGSNLAVFELSGGIDSSVVAALCKMALGKNNTFGIILPYKDTPKESVDLAYSAGRKIGIRYMRFNITPQIDYYYRNFPQAGRTRRQNKMARERMSILYDLAFHFNGVVVGKSNKSEIYLGEGTIYGDFAYDINPIADLYKTQIFQLAEYLKIPQEIIEQKKEIKIGEENSVPYQIVDSVIYYYVEKGMKPSDISSTINLKETDVKKIIDKINKSENMRKQPLIAKIPDEIKYFKS
ncbi:MAG: NAD(+) synthase [Candidatus Omnitrophota bacterium]|nr:MAG: NAD(+) synthase [Candidatus Omnitrophota bacterium]